MIKCNYAEHFGCSECSVAFHKECKQFVMAHAKWLSGSVQPFKYDNKVTVDYKDRVIVSSNEVRAKSASLLYALHSNKRIRRLSASQALTIAVSNEVLDDGVIYIDCKRIHGDCLKISNVLYSFAEVQVMNGSYVVFHVPPTVRIQLDYPTL